MLLIFVVQAKVSSLQIPTSLSQKTFCDNNFYRKEFPLAQTDEESPQQQKIRNSLPKRTTNGSSFLAMNLFFCARTWIKWLDWLLEKKMLIIDMFCKEITLLLSLHAAALFVLTGWFFFVGFLFVETIGKGQVYLSHCSLKLDIGTHTGQICIKNSFT